MADIIQLLPDAIANQIAAGEVIQRPASVVKELLENSVDAGATRIQLLVREAGRVLVQVTDNGKGMSSTDSRMCFERHATSKIRRSEDLFDIQTKGFRGEAMASIAAIAQVEMKTRREEDELGTKLNIEASTIKSQEVCQCPKGSSIQVKNLFYNVPVRRKFLKSNTVEMRHIVDEFQRVALAHPEIFFSLHHNTAEIFHLLSGNYRQRIVGILGTHTNKKLVPVREDTDALKIQGFVGKPEFAKKSRGNQFFFVNNRFIKSTYLNHAVMAAYEELLAPDTFPLYVVYMDIDPGHIDVNVHPTKQEIKFDDERLIYNYIKVAIRHALGQHSITPSLDFSQDAVFNKFLTPQTPKKNYPQTPTGKKNYQQKDFSNNSNKNQAEKSNLEDWQKLYDGLDAFDPENSDENAVPEGPLTIESTWTDATPIDDQLGSFSKQQKKPYQLHNRFIISQIKSGFFLFDQQSSHERILYEKYVKALDAQQVAVQQLLFPEEIAMAEVDAPLFRELMPQINALGFNIQESEQGGFVVHGLPTDWQKGQLQSIIEVLLEQYKQNIDLHLELKENLARALARSTAVKRGQELSTDEMQVLIDQLFACDIPYKGPDGRPCFTTFELEELEKRFI